MNVTRMLTLRIPSRLRMCLALLAALAVGTLSARAEEKPGHAQPVDGQVAAGEQPGEPAEGGKHPETEHKSKYADPPLDFDLSLFVYTLVIFLVLLFVGSQIAWKPLIAGLDAREARINQAYAAAKGASRVMEQCSRDYEARIAATTEQVKAIVAEARLEAERAKQEVVAAATAEANALQERAIADIGRAREQALAELHAAVEQQTDLATDQILGYHLAGR